MKKIEKKNDVEKTMKKKKVFSNAVILIVLVLVSLVGVFFLSTYIRWNAEINSKNEILYYGQEELKINNIKDFYGNVLEHDLNEDEALLMYCSNSYGGDCIAGDYSNKLENMFRSPRVIINIVILADLFLLFALLENKNISKIKVYIVSSLILIYGLYNIGIEMYNFSDYYKLTNRSKDWVNSTIYKGLKTKNKDYFKPVVSYTTDNGAYILYLDYDMEGNIGDNINKELTLYYDKKDNGIVTPKRNLNKFVLPIIVDLLIIIFGFIYLSLKKIKKNS